jgi:amphi-Trp domain-containing protein
MSIFEPRQEVQSMAKKIEKEQKRAQKRALKAERRQHRRKAQAVLSREQIAGQLRALASQVEAGTFALGDAEVELPAEAEFEISYKPTKKGGHEIEVEIEWGGPQQVALLPAE